MLEMYGQNGVRSNPSFLQLNVFYTESIMNEDVINLNCVSWFRNFMNSKVEGFDITNSFFFKCGFDCKFN